MTCIVGYVDKDGVYIGGDSAAVSDDLSYNIINDEKVFLKGEMIFGFSSSFRMGQLLRYKVRIPNHPKGMDDIQYMATLFIDSVKKCFVENDYNDMVADDAAFIIGYKGKLYSVFSDFQIHHSKENYVATGSGEYFALGAMYALTLAEKEAIKKISENESTKKLIDKDPIKKMEIALSAASTFSMCVKPPYTFVKLLNKKKNASKK